MKQEPEQQQALELPGNVKVLGIISLLNDLASEMIFPLLPTFLLTLLGGNRFYLGMIEGAADSVASLLKLWSGGRSDQTGRRRGFVLFGYSLATIARPLIGLITVPWQLLLIRIGDRIGKGIRTSPRDALIADSTDKSIRGRAFGFHRSMDHLGAAIGPLLATGFLLVWPDSMRALFLWSLLPGILVVSLVLLGLRETPAVESTPKPLKLTLRPFGGNFRWFLLTLLIFTLGNSSDAFLLVRAGELGVRKEFLPLLWCVFHIAKSSSNWLLGFAVDRYGPRRFISMGWIIYAAVYLAFGFASQAWHAWGLFLGYALFYGLTEPAEKTLVAQIVPADRKGLAFGWFNFTIGVGTLPASLIFGAIYQYAGPLAAFGWGAVLATIAIILMAFVRDHESELDSAEP